MWILFEEKPYPLYYWEEICQRHLWLDQQKSTMWTQITTSHVFMNIFSFKRDMYLLSVNFFLVLIVFNLYKQIISYGRAELKKVGEFYVLTRLILAGPVTFVKI